MPALIFSALLRAPLGVVEAKVEVALLSATVFSASLNMGECAYENGVIRRASGKAFAHCRTYYRSLHDA
jgi:hypothetical protein